MKSNNRNVLSIWILCIIGMFTLSPIIVQAQSYAAWYSLAQKRINTLRKGNFGIKIVDKNGQPYSGLVSVRMAKHEFPFGIAFDFYEAPVSMGNSYSTTAAINCKADQEIYKTDRRGGTLVYAIPVESGKKYKLTLKFTENYYSKSLRSFNVSVEGQLLLKNFDIFANAGGKNIAKDTVVYVTPTDNSINIELKALRDNASISGIVIDEVGGVNVIRINCGGASLTTQDGNQYVSEVGYFDPDVKTVNTATKEEWMKAAMYKYFNSGVSGNSFKWSGIQSQHIAPNYANFDNAVNWTRKVGWELKGHTLLWGGDNDHSMPGWVRALPTPKAINDTCKMRVIREMTRYKGIVKEYDVM
ncbi:MAG TPA: malectin domain-containing carbohydrate-binding protein, partial [Paludibacter sp.]